MQKLRFLSDLGRTLGCQIDEYTRLFGTQETWRKKQTQSQTKVFNKNPPYSFIWAPESTYVFGTIGFGGWRQVFSALTAVRHTFSWLRVELKGYLWKSNHDFLNFVFDAVVFFWLFWNSATQQRHLNNSQFNNFSSSFSPRTIKQRTYVDIYIWVSSYASYFFFKLRIQYSEFSWIHLTITTITILRVWHFHEKKYLNSVINPSLNFLQQTATAELRKCLNSKD